MTDEKQQLLTEFNKLNKDEKSFFKKFVSDKCLVFCIKHTLNSPISDSIFKVILDLVIGSDTPNPKYTSTVVRLLIRGSKNHIDFMNAKKIAGVCEKPNCDNCYQCSMDLDITELKISNDPDTFLDSISKNKGDSDSVYFQQNLFKNNGNE
jgi:hypothetical protein